MKKVKTFPLITGTSKKNMVHWISEYLLIKNWWQIGKFRRNSDRLPSLVSFGKEWPKTILFRWQSDLIVKATGIAQNSILIFVIVHDSFILFLFTQMDLASSCHMLLTSITLKNELGFFPGHSINIRQTHYVVSPESCSQPFLLHSQLWYHQITVQTHIAYSLLLRGSSSLLIWRYTQVVFQKWVSRLVSWLLQKSFLF